MRVAVPLLALAAASSPALAQDAVPRELAAALIDGAYAPRTSAAALVVGRAPDGFPALAAVPAGARVLGGVRWWSGGALVAFQSDAAPDAARQAALAALDRAGWRAPVPRPEPPFPRFLNSAVADDEREVTRCAPGGGASAVIVDARPRPDAGGALVRLRAVRREGMCGPPPTVAARAFDRRPPRVHLAPPAGVRLREDFEGNHFLGATVAAAVTDSAADAAALRAHYNQQFAAARWTPFALRGQDTAHAGPLFLSPPDSAGGYWSAVVSTRPDTAGRVRLSLLISAVVAGRRDPFAAMNDLAVGAGSTSWSSMPIESRPSPATLRTPRTPPRRAPGPLAGRDTAAAVPRELVDALLRGSWLNPEGEAGRAPLHVGRAPAGWRAPLPTAADRRVLGARGGWAPYEGAQVVVTASGTPEGALAAYGRQLDAAGWRRAPMSEQMYATAPGFLPGPAVASVTTPETRCAPDEAGRAAEGVTVSVSPRAAGGVTFHLAAIGRELAEAWCAAPGARSSVGARLTDVVGGPRVPIPSLTAPRGFTVTEGRGSGGPERWDAAATVYGAASPEAVVAAYLPQLRQAGWVPGAPAAAGDVAVARLARVAAGDEPAWVGTLTAAWRGDGGYVVRLEAERLDRGRR